MPTPLNGFNITFIWISIIFGATALLFSCVGIGTPNWQVTEATIDGDTYIARTANFFYACYIYKNGSSTNCISRSTNRDIQRYYPIDARWNQTEWTSYLDSAAGLCIIGIIFLFLGIISTVLMMFLGRFLFISILSPVSLFFACLFMLAGMSSGANVLFYNGYSANLYQTAYLFTIFSFLLTSIVSGRIFPALLPPDVHFSPLK